MISRQFAAVETVAAFAPRAFHSCTVAGFTCTAIGWTCAVGSTGWHGGNIIDRLGLDRIYRSVHIAPTIEANPLVSDPGGVAALRYMAVKFGLQHSSTTCQADFDSYSSQDWVAERPLFWYSTSTATSTSGAGAPGFFDPNVIAVGGYLTTAATTATSTGFAGYVGGTIGFDLSGANRYLRLIVTPRIETTGCGGSNMTVGAALVFGDPEEAPAGTAPRARSGTSCSRTLIFVTSACAT